ncbi:MAG: phosphotransferase [Candidatus Latescibacteria bacterium]|nr:phosphotransferase [Candidatus Latescibacterota bacterium]
MKDRISYLDEQGLPAWVPRVAKIKIAELYRMDAGGIHDTDLLDEVGIALLARCQSILTVAAAIEGQYECPACLAAWGQAADNREVLTCPACGWTITWAQFQATYHHLGLSFEIAVEKAFYETFVKAFPRVGQAGRKMVLIDTLIHQFHRDEIDGPPTSLVAFNLIQGIAAGAKMEDMIEFLDHLSYGQDSLPEIRQTLSKWRDKMGAYWGRKVDLAIRTRFHILLLHPTRPRLLLIQKEDGWHLVCVDSDERFGWRDMESLTQEVRRLLADGVSGLECLSYVQDGAEHWELICHFEHRGDEPVTTDGRWCYRADIEQLDFAVPEHKGLAEQCLKEVEGVAEPDRRSPWSCPGWADEAEAWLLRQLDEMGCRLLQPVWGFYRHGLANTIHAQTSAGEFYMKASSFLPMLVDEPRLTGYLAAEFPEFVPAPIRVHAQRRWMLLPDLGYPIRAATEDMKKEALLAFGRLQRQAIGHVDKLLRLGCADRRLDKLEPGIEAIVQLDEATAGLGKEELEGVRRALPRFRDIARELAGYNLPNTLGHGDLHPGNVAHRDGAYMFFDWGQGRVTHPFLDAWGFIQDSEMQSIPEEEYLALWAEYESPERLRQALLLARPLCILSETIDQCHFNVNLRQPEELRGCLTNHLRAILNWAETK